MDSQFQDVHINVNDSKARDEGSFHFSAPFVTIDEFDAGNAPETSAASPSSSPGPSYSKPEQTAMDDGCKGSNKKFQLSAPGVSLNTTDSHCVPAAVPAPAPAPDAPPTQTYVPSSQASAPAPRTTGLVKIKTVKAMDTLG